MSPNSILKKLLQVKNRYQSFKVIANRFDGGAYIVGKTMCGQTVVVINTVSSVELAQELLVKAGC